jgi:ParB-like chromosome segregation protein Spo0J
MSLKKEFVTVPLEKLIPYENNPRVNDAAIPDVIESIKQCENLDPIEVDENFVILSGHTRYAALKKLGYTETEVVQYEGLSEEQKRKYRILANKTNELADWDFSKLEQELADLDFSDFSFDFGLDDNLQDGGGESVYWRYTNSAI